MTEKYRVRVLNHISAGGLKRLPWDRLTVSADVDDPHAILVRSASLHDLEIPEALLAVGRAGSGTNNIPIARMSERGIPVFNAPGANANAVKELVVAGTSCSRRATSTMRWKYLDSLDPEDPELEQKVEAGKKAFAGYELAGQTLGIVGLGKIGCLVADAAIKLGMHVIGYDPEITVDSAWSPPSTVKKAHSLSEVLKHSNFITLHVPLVDETRGMTDAGGIAQMKAGAVVLNSSGRRSRRDRDLGGSGYRSAGEVCLRLSRSASGQSARVILLPHLGALDARGGGELRSDGR